MPSFSRTSRARLDTCHPDLQLIMETVIDSYDITIVCGHRGEAEQMLAFETGRSQLAWPRSKHNGMPSMAVDIAPYPIDWNDRESFTLLAGWVLCVADTLYEAGQVSHRLRWGGDWNGD